MEQLTGEARRPRRGVFSAFNLLFSLLFLVLCALTLFFVFSELFDKTESELTRFTEAIARRFDQSLRLSVENLRSVSNLVVSLEDIDLQQFRDITAPGFKSDAGLLLIEWQPVVPGDQRVRFEAEARARGLTDFRLWEPDENGVPVAAKARPEHVPVYFMRARDATDDVMSTLGLDLAWSPLRMRSKWQARDSGLARGSELFEVVTEGSDTANRLVFSISLPVYRGGFAPADEARRREELLGFLAGVYVLEDVLGGELEHALASGLNVEVRDTGLTQEDVPIRLLVSTGDASSFDSEVELDVYGNALRLRVVATDRFVSEQFEALWLALPGAVLLLGLITMYFLRRLEIEQLRLVAAKQQLQALNVQLQELSDSDPLTGLYNRRAMQARIGQELDRIARHGGVISLLMVDIDHFKTVNDNWGHNSGDEVLVEFARMCKSATRNLDMVSRWGGEEFAILLAQAGHTEALQFAQRLRREVAGRAFPVADLQAEVHITASIGISTIRESVPATQWIEQADRALYEAKRSGRNCVRAFQ